MTGLLTVNTGGEFLEKHSNVCYVREKDGTYTPRKDGVIIKNNFGADIFRSRGQYYEGRTGILVGGANALDYIQRDSEGKAEKYAKNVKSFEEQYGLTPRYTQPEIMKSDVFPRDDRKILAPALYHKGKCRFTRVYDENGITLYTMDKNSIESPAYFTACKGYMIGIGYDKENVIEYLSQPNFDLYDEIVKRYEASIQYPGR